MAEYLDFPAPPGLRVRGTVVVVPGRGETAHTYRRFGHRIAADAYPVRVLGPRSATVSVPALAAELAAAVDELGYDVVRPLVVVGADVSAAALAALAAGPAADDRWWPDALVLAAPPGYGTHDAGTDWDSELAVRTHCPAHRGALSADSSFTPGTLGDPVPDALLDAAYGSTATLPQLLLVGDRDPIADHEALARSAKALPTSRLSVVRGAHHDVLNDLQHRCVAAEVISFLEVLRDGAPLRPIVSAEVSAW